MSEFIWEEPPVLKRAGPAYNEKYPDLANRLRRRPGEWARILTMGTKESAQTTANALRHGKKKGFEDGRFEAVSRELDVYARYLGPNEESEKEGENLNGGD